MLKRSLLVSSLCALNLFATESKINETSCKPLQSMRVGARYTSPKGIGYKQGYTTLEGFFARPTPFNGCWLPFLDVRGHVFDNGRFAANAGLGVRLLTDARVWGVNTYYDYRNTSHFHYNQAAIGFESLGSVWDYRVNGYLPVGKKVSRPYHAEFYEFKKNYVLLKYSQEFALGGVNAEVGAHVDHFKTAPLYFAGGPYYLTGRMKTTWGGEFRGRVDLFKRYLRLEASVSYDHFFKWTGQGQISVNVSFGGRNKKKQCEKMTLYARAVQSIDRAEIIPVSKRHVITPAINPATGQPWVFWFVDNTSHSAGTFENPFATLLGAQNASSKNQAIYIFPGDGTTNGLSDGIALQDNQILCGASVALTIPTTLGQITIAPTASSLPMLTNESGNIVTLANNNTISGLYITTAIDSSNGLYGNGITNLTVDSSTFTSPTTIATNGIDLANSSGNLLINNSSFSGFTCTDMSNNGNGIYIDGGTLNTLNVTASNFSNISDPSGGIGGNGIFTNGSITSLISSGNTFSDLSSGYGIGTGDPITTFTVSDNTFNNLTNGSVGIYTGDPITTFTVSDNTFSNLTGGSSIYTNGSITTFTLSGNTFSTLSGGGEGIYTGSPITTFTLSDNTFSNLTATNGIVNGTSITTLTLSGNTFSNVTGASVIYTGSPITTFTLSGNTFSNLTNSSAIFNTGSITTLTLSGDIFDSLDSSIGISNGAGSITTLTMSRSIFNQINNSSVGIYNEASIITFNSSRNTFSTINSSSSAIINAVSNTTFTSSSDTFSGINNSSHGIQYNLSASNASVVISDDTFGGDTGLPSGFATTITVSGGSLCLDFTNNTATPSSGTSAYTFTKSGGTFNSTSDSTMSNNVGQFSIGSDISFPGTCTALQNLIKPDHI